MRGNTRNSSRTDTLFWDHPRVCGEHHRILFYLTDSRGSSPRMRGTRWRAGHPYDRQGIIPAYAGNTPNSADACWICWDHPRVCGEHITCRQPLLYHKGSSPRMRGTPDGCILSGWEPGIIPAYAGNTQCLPSPLLASRDHPRVCGEHKFRRSKGFFCSGSSPRMRGTRSHGRE